jgi:hypothetical protein
MKLLFLPLLLTTLALTPTPHPLAEVPATQPRFAYVDIFIDSHDKALGAYQFELKATTGHVTVVGIEGAATGPFAKKPPYYDPAAMGQDRVIIAAFSTDAGLPVGRTRIARVHVMIEGLPEDSKPKYDVNLTVAADNEGKSIAGSTATVE